MGVPAFYRWISEKYPKIVVNVLERRPQVINGTVLPVDLNEPNPNGVEFDNLYIDMNGLIHPCSHPEDREAPKTEEEMYNNVCKYLDRIIASIRPRKVLFLAIDGVAPRAKMNQQRSRRFRSAQEAKEKREMMEQVLDEMQQMGVDAPERKHTEEWDSNVITPGTEFMTKISTFLRHYILDRMNRSKYWRNLTVILSDASEPGEGEHKIMDYIRKQRTQVGYDPSTHHVLHGLDADLIMLALATHEVRFTILREKVTFGNRKSGSEESEVSQEQRLLDAQSMFGQKVILCQDPADEWLYAKPLQALHIHILREYLAGEFGMLRAVLPFQYDLERIIDDFIFLCFFVGNDFLPHLPSLDIRDGALDFLIECYKDILPSLGGYITSPGGHINLPQADVILSRVGEVEDQIFLRKKSSEDAFERKKNNRQRRPADGQQQQQLPPPRSQQQQQQQQVAPVIHRRFEEEGDNKAAADMIRNSLLGKRRSVAAAAPEEEAATAAAALAHATEGKDGNGNTMDVVTTPTATTAADAAAATDTAAEAEVETWESDEEEVIESILTAAPKRRKLNDHELQQAKEELKRRIKEKENSLVDTYKQTISDDVRLHETGWKGRYYNEPFKKQNIESGGGLQKMCFAYVQGLCWVLKYYYQGVPSWNWFYPFHYAPFASDLVNIDSYEVLGVQSFELSSPFRPLEQLLAVLPASSHKALPPECHWLMLDSSSPIIDIYNDDVPIDPNGKHLPWLWILLLPFLDESRISAAFDLCRTQLQLDSRRRNSQGKSVIFVSEEKCNAKLAREQGLLHPAPEHDPEVIDALLAAGFDEAEILQTDHQSAAQHEQQLLFTCAQGDGVSGILTPSPRQWYVPPTSPIGCPGEIQKWFTEGRIQVNRVLVFEYSLPSSTAHESKILPGAIPLPSILEHYDLLPKRPPRLNKSGFNVLELFQSVRQGGHQGQGHGQGMMSQSYNPHMSNHGHNDNNNNRGYGQQGHSQGGGGRGGGGRGNHNSGRGGGEGSYQQEQSRQHWQQQSYHQQQQQPHYNQFFHQPSQVGSFGRVLAANNYGQQAAPVFRAPPPMPPQHYAQHNTRFIDIPVAPALPSIGAGYGGYAVQQPQPQTGYGSGSAYGNTMPLYQPPRAIAPQLQASFAYQQQPFQQQQQSQQASGGGGFRHQAPPASSAVAAPRPGDHRVEPLRKNNVPAAPVRSIPISNSRRPSKMKILGQDEVAVPQSSAAPVQSLEEMRQQMLRNLNQPGGGR